MRAIILAIVFAAAATTSAFATPGAVDKHGCHGKPKHCHSISSTNKFKTSNRRYVPFNGRG